MNTSLAYDGRQNAGMGSYICVFTQSEMKRKVRDFCGKCGKDSASAEEAP